MALNKKGLKNIEKVVKEFFKKMTVEVEFELKEGAEDHQISLDLKTEEPQILIGQRGKTLSDLQRVLGRLLRKEAGEEVFLDLDINQYKMAKIQHLKEMAQEIADRVALEGKEQILFPMSSYERRLIHLELAKRTDVKTGSIGEGPERRVVIKPA